MSFTPNIPASGQSLGQTRQAILNNFAILRSTIAVDHVDVNASGNGKHKYVHLTDQSASIPTTAANELVFFNKLVSGTARLFLRQPSSGTQIQMSGINPLSSTNGYTFLPGGILLQWGSQAKTGNQTPVTFPIQFDAIYSITISTQTTSSTADLTAGVRNGTVTTSGFSINCSSSGNVTAFYWMAIGTKA